MSPKTSKKVPTNFMITTTVCALCSAKFAPGSKAAAKHAKLPHPKPKFEKDQWVTRTRHIPGFEPRVIKCKITQVFYRKDTHAVFYSVIEEHSTQWLGSKVPTVTWHTKTNVRETSLTAA